MKSLVISAGLFIAAAQPVAAADRPAFDGPVFDTHMHYSRSAWEIYSPGDVLQKMDKANVRAALVSSTPDEGTAKLVAHAPGRITAGFRPYRTPLDKTRWFKSADLLSRAATRLLARWSFISPPILRRRKWRNISRWWRRGVWYCIFIPTLPWWRRFLNSSRR